MPCSSALFYRIYSYHVRALWRLNARTFWITKFSVDVILTLQGRIPSPGQALYSAAKFGLNGYFAALATEVCDRCGKFWTSLLLHCGYRARAGAPLCGCSPSGGLARSAAGSRRARNIAVRAKHARGCSLQVRQGISSWTWYLDVPVGPRVQPSCRSKRCVRCASVPVRKPFRQSCVPCAQGRGCHNLLPRPNRHRRCAEPTRCHGRHWCVAFVQISTTSQIVLSWLISPNLACISDAVYSLPCMPGTCTGSARGVHQLCASALLREQGHVCIADRHTGQLCMSCRHRSDCVASAGRGKADWHSSLVSTLPAADGISAFAGMITKQQETSAGGTKRLEPQSVAAWIVAAAHHGVGEAWIAKQPILLLSACTSTPS